MSLKACECPGTEVPISAFSDVFPLNLKPIKTLLFLQRPAQKLPLLRILWLKAITLSFLLTVHLVYTLLKVSIFALNSSHLCLC